MDLRELSRIFRDVGASGASNGTRAASRVLNDVPRTLEQLDRGNYSRAIRSGSRAMRNADTVREEASKHVPQERESQEREPQNNGELRNNHTSSWQNRNADTFESNIDNSNEPTARMAEPAARMGEPAARTSEPVAPRMSEPAAPQTLDSADSIDSFGRQEMMALQAGLQIAGYESVGSLDGIAGPKTNGAIEQYAQDRGIQFEEGNYEAILESLKNDQVVQVRMEHAVDQGMSADPSLSRAVQTMLKGTDHDPGLIDGKIGPITTAAFNDYKASTDDFGSQPIVRDGAAVSSDQSYEVGAGTSISHMANDQADRLAEKGYNFETGTGPVARSNGTSIEETPATDKPSSPEATVAQERALAAGNVASP